MALSPLDRERLQEALDLAETAVGVSEPNPRVGCIVGTADGRVLGQGATRRAGGPHAEVVALREAQAAGHDTTGATAWVTLEPCAHHGRTPPCADALVAARVGRVVVATIDPFPRVAGAGIARLRAAGIEVEMADAAVADAARWLNIGFFSRVLRRRPWVRLKAAISLDGRLALANGASRWITGVEARTDGHAWRRRAGAVLSGIGTVLADDPRLDVRSVPTEVQPARVIVDSALRMPVAARLLAPPGRVIVATGVAPADPRAQALAATGAELLTLAGEDGRVDLGRLLDTLAETGVNELHVEAGATLNGALLGAGLVDELLVYQAPRVLGSGPALASFGPLAAVDEAPAWTWIECTPVGTDLRMRAVAREPGSWMTPAQP